MKFLVGEIFLVKIQFLLQRIPPAASSAVPGLEEKLAALEKSRDYQTGINNLESDNVAIPNRPANIG